MRLTNLFLVFGLLYFGIMFYVNHAYGNDMEINSFYVCQMEAGDVGKIKYRSNDIKDAMLSVARRCVNMRSISYQEKYGNRPSTERIIMFVENCTNNTSCVHHEVHQPKRDKYDYEL